MSTASKMIKHKKKEIKSNNRLMILGILAILLFFVAIAYTFLNVQNNQYSCSGKLTATIKYNCYLTYALRSGNATICNGLNYNYSNQCIMHVASNYSNINDCNLISNNTIKYECVSKISIMENKPSYCNNLNTSVYYQCLYANAKAENFTNYALCNEIGNSSLRNTCLSVYYFKLTYASGANYCNYITNKPNYSILYDMVYFTNNSLIAINNAYEYTYYNITPYAYCVSYVAYKSNNQSLCNFLNNTNNTLCKSSFYNKLSNTSISNVRNECLNQNTTVRSLCLYSIEIYNATQSKNVSSCLKINNTFYQNSCISSIAQAYNNSNYCNYIKNSSAKYDCNLLLGNYS